jgi:signal transduction histidine kinase
MDGVENYARTLGELLNSRVEVAAGRREGLAALRRAVYGVVVVEEGLAESDPAWADQVWELAGYAVLLQVNFAISGCARLGREVKAALARRDGDQAIARRAVTSEMESQLRSSLTGLLLQSELALREPSVSAELASKLQHVVDLAGAIRERLTQGVGFSGVRTYGL